MIRCATMRDIEAVALIYERIHEEEKAGRMCIGWRPGVYPVRETAETAAARSELFVAEEHGMIIGSAIINHRQMPGYEAGSWSVVTDEEEKLLVMHTLTIDPRYGGRGYGRAFVAFYEGLARAKGCLALRIDTQEKNTVARAMYGRCGFTEVGIVPVGFNGIPGVRLVLLEKRLLE